VRQSEQEKKGESKEEPARVPKVSVQQHHLAVSQYEGACKQESERRIGEATTRDLRCLEALGAEL